MVFLGDSKSEAKEGAWGMVASVVLLAVLSIVSGILVSYPLNFLQSSLSHILGVI